MKTIYNEISFLKSPTSFKRKCIKRPGYPPRGGGGVLSYIGYIGVCGLKENGFLAVLIRNLVSILAILVSNRVHGFLTLDCFFIRRSDFFIITVETINKSLL